MLASIHLADVGVRRATAALARNLDPADVPGLEWASTVVGSPLGSRRTSPPQPGRLGLLALWEDEAALDAFNASHTSAATLAAGWHVRLATINAHEYHRSRGSEEAGSWPGVPGDVTGAACSTGPVVVLTLARTRLPRLPALLAATRRAARPLADAPGFIWGVALSRLPVIATVTLWESAAATEAYAYGPSGAGHASAMAADRAKALHRSGVFFRFRPLQSEGGLTGRNPLPTGWLRAQGSVAH